jgi:hypothetical protein
MNAEWAYGAVAFIDILGFTALVEADSKSLHASRMETLRTLLVNVKDTSRDLDVRAFSDSITIATPLTLVGVINLFEAVTSLQRRLVNGGVLVRGGIALGKHFADEILVYSEALIQAYLLERDKARFPRILADGDLLDWFFHHGEITDAQQETLRSMLLVDRDNQLFIDYLLPEDIDQHLAILNTYKPKNATPSVLEKIQWLGQYHNFVATKNNHHATFSGPMLDGFKKYIVKP